MGAVLCAGLALGLAACGDEDEGTESGSTNGNSSSTPAPEQAPAPPESDSDAESSDVDSSDVDSSDKDPDEAAHASGTACLVGTWLTDNKHVGAMLQGVAGDTNVSEPTGEALITFFEGGRHDVTYKAWTFAMSHQGVAVDVVRDGTDSGTYQATDDGQLTTTEADMGSVVAMTTPAGTHSTPGEPSTMTGTFTCRGSTLEITVDDATSIMNRQ